jgi:GNAT superfamily N-acetyltransferase
VEAHPLEAAREQIHGIRPAAADEARPIARTLADAFTDDPIAAWTLPDDAQRHDRLDRTFLALARKLWLDQAAVYTTPDLAGVAVWHAPGTWRLSAAKQLRLMPAMLRAYGRWTGRVVRLVTYYERKHPREPHWYLEFLGVSPDWQGRGLGTALMAPILDRCDREGVPAYLESSTPRSRICYERAGFEVMEELASPGDCPPAWAMWRKPR